MSGRTWLVMLVILGINWGGFALALGYALKRERKDKKIKDKR